MNNAGRMAMFVVVLGVLAVGAVLSAWAAGIVAGTTNRLSRSSPCAPPLPDEFFGMTVGRTEATVQNSAPGMVASAISADAKAFVQQLIAFPNEKDQQQFQRYLDRNIVYNKVSDVGKSNLGIILQNEKSLNDNKCFFLLAQSFYKKIQKRTTGWGQRPSLNDSASDDEHREQFGENWLWNLALEHAGGNSNLAMSLIGVCGHDDINQGTGTKSRGQNTFSATISLKDPKLSPYLKAVTTSRDNCCKGQVAGSECNTEKEARLLAELATGAIGFKASVNCPVKNAFFLPGSIHGLELREQTRKAVSESQGNDILFAANVPPAKAYHQMGSAFLVCDLIQRGMDPNSAQNMQTLFAAAYRATRICTSRESDKAIFSSVEAEMNKLDDDTLFNKVKKLRAQNRNGDGLNAQNASGTQDDKFSRHLSNIGFPEHMSDEVLRAKIQSLRAYLIASKIFRERKPGPTTSANLYKAYRMPDLYRRMENSKGGLFYSLKKAAAETIMGHAVPEKECIINNIQTHMDRPTKYVCPKGISDQLCSLVKRKLASWDDDMDWTREAHQIGGEFAKQQCNSHRPSEQLVCETFRKRGLPSLPACPLPTIPVIDGKVVEPVQGIMQKLQAE